MATGFDALMRAMERPCRIEAALYSRPEEARLPWQRSYLTCERLPLSHIERCFGSAFHQRPVPPQRAEFSTCLHWPNGVPEAARKLITLLQRSLVLPTDSNRIDLALALDWYKIVDDEVPATQWENTEAGQLVFKAKYWTSSPATRRAAAHELIDMLSAAIAEHPSYREAAHLVSVPGSSGDGVSVAEYIAAHVAEQTGKNFVKTIGPARDPRKGGGALPGLDGHFSVPTALQGACVVVDDVYKSGMTMRATALAAHQAGATSVYGLVAAKTVSG